LFRCLLDDSEARHRAPTRVDLQWRERGSTQLVGVDTSLGDQTKAARDGVSRFPEVHAAVKAAGHQLANGSSFAGRRRPCQRRGARAFTQLGAAQKLKRLWRLALGGGCSPPDAQPAVAPEHEAGLLRRPGVARIGIPGKGVQGQPSRGCAHHRQAWALLPAPILGRACSKEHPESRRPSCDHRRTACVQPSDRGVHARELQQLVHHAGVDPMGRCCFGDAALSWRDRRVCVVLELEAAFPNEQLAAAVQRGDQSVAWVRQHGQYVVLHAMPTQLTLLDSLSRPSIDVDAAQPKIPSIRCADVLHERDCRRKPIFARGSLRQGRG